MSFLSPNEAARLSLSLPRHVSHMTKLQANFEKRTGLKTVVVSGFRSNKQQAATHSDSVAAARNGQGYRAAPAGSSKHEVGAATDLNIVGEQTAGDASKDARNRYYVILAEEARKIGLKPGMDFKTGDPDPYHFEEPETLDTLKKEYTVYRIALLTLLGVVVVAFFFITGLARGPHVVS